MHRDILHQHLEELDQLTHFSADLGGVEFLQAFPFKIVKEMFTRSLRNQDFEGVLLSGVSMLHIYDQVLADDDPAKEDILDLIDAHFSFASLLLGMLLDELATND